MKKYKSIGIVLGKTWGGGFGSYPAERLYAKTRKTLLKEAKKLLETGGLDSGMGFEYLKGALIDIEEVEMIEKNGKIYERSEFESEFIGDLTEKEQDFLTESSLNY